MTAEPKTAARRTYTGRRDRHVRVNLDDEALEALLLQGVDLPQVILRGMYARKAGKRNDGGMPERYRKVIDRVEWDTIAVDIDYDLDADFTPTWVDGVIYWTERYLGKRQHRSDGMQESLYLDAMIERDVEAIQ